MPVTVTVTKFKYKTSKVRKTFRTFLLSATLLVNSQCHYCATHIACSLNAVYGTTMSTDRRWHSHIRKLIMNKMVQLALPDQVYNWVKDFCQGALPLYQVRRWSVSRCGCHGQCYTRLQTWSCIISSKPPTGVPVILHACHSGLTAGQCNTIENIQKRVIIFYARKQKSEMCWDRRLGESPQSTNVSED